MQAIYSFSKNAGLKRIGLTENLHRSITQTYHLHHYILLILTEVAAYVVEDNYKRANKLLKVNDSDPKPTYLLENQFIQFLLNSPSFNKLVLEGKLKQQINPDLAKNIYAKLVDREEYQNYLAGPKPSMEQDRDIIKILFKKILIKAELFEAHLEDTFPNWEDDRKTVIASLSTFINGFHQKEKHQSLFIPAEEWKERLDFSDKLISSALDNDAEYIELIEPQLRNWDLERVTSIDVILIKMALAELLNFPAIPVKVTINEYIDISKIYSTPKSKDFINGILDKLMKKLNKDGLIKKTGRGLLG